MGGPEAKLFWDNNIVLAEKAVQPKENRPLGKLAETTQKTDGSVVATEQRIAAGLVYGNHNSCFPHPGEVGQGNDGVYYVREKHNDKKGEIFDGFVRDSIQTGGFG